MAAFLRTLYTVAYIAYITNARQCSIRKAFKFTKYEEPHYFLVKNASSIGAVVSLHSDDDSENIQKRWNCQLKNHETYCGKNGYKCYIITDSQRWRLQRDNLVGHWMKLQVVREVLLNHSWVLYLDLDSIFENPLTAPPIESLITRKDISLVLPGGKGWSTDMMLFLNTAWSDHFLKHFWTLRRFCPDCIKEQCAAHLAMYNAMLFHSYREVEAGLRPDDILVSDVRGRSCCLPKSHCKYPFGDGGPQNYGHSDAVQGCVWNWQTALGFNPNSSLPSRTDHPHIDWAVELRAALNISHPRKHMSC